MNTDNITHRIEILKTKHKLQHSIIEALEGEKAPDRMIKSAKLEKLKIKDEIANLETSLLERVKNEN